MPMDSSPLPMRSRSSPTASAVRAERAFTLAELICVIAIVALISSVLATSLVRASPTRDRQAALGHLVTYLSLARLDSMQSAQWRTVEVGIDGIHLRAQLSAGGSRSWTLPPTTLAMNTSEAATSLRADFDSIGRTSARIWNFIPQRPDEPIWTIAFDPLSGTPRLVRTDKEDPP